MKKDVPHGNKYQEEQCIVDGHLKSVTQAIRPAHPFCCPGKELLLGTKSVIKEVKVLVCYSRPLWSLLGLYDCQGSEGVNVLFLQVILICVDYFAKQGHLDGRLYFLSIALAYKTKPTKSR